MSMLPNGLNLLPIGNGGTITAAPNYNTVATTSAPLKEHDIQGHMFAVRKYVDDTKLEDNNISPDEIKKQLTALLVEELYNSKHIEYTKLHDPVNGQYVFHARIFAVPDTMVRILRENGK